MKMADRGRTISQALVAIPDTPESERPDSLRLEA